MTDASAGKTLLEQFVNTFRWTDPNSPYVCQASSSEDIREDIIFQRQIELWGEGFEYIDRLRMNKGVDRRNANFNPDWAFIESDSGLAKLHLSKKRIFTIDLSLDEIERQLNPDMFLRVTRYHIVNISAVERLTTWFGRKTKVQVADWPEAEIYVIKEKAPVLKRWLDR